MPARNLIPLVILSTLLVVACNRQTSEEEGPAGNGTDAANERTEPLTREEAQSLAEETADQFQASFLEASQTLNLDSCDEISSMDLRFACTQNVFYKLAVSSGEKSKCKKLENPITVEQCQAEIEA